MRVPSSLIRPGVGAAVGLLLGVVVLGPALAPGYTLHYLSLIHI